MIALAALVPLGGCQLTDLTGPSQASSPPTFSVTESALEGRAGHVAALLPGGRVLVAGGANGTVRLASAESFDPASRTWSAAPGMAHARLGHAAVGLANGRVLVLGGHSVDQACSPILQSAEIYDPALGTWTSAADMSVARNSPAAVLLADGRVLVAGGGDRCGGVWASAEIYDPATGTWRPTGAMRVARQAAAAVLLADGRVLVAGGVSDGSGARPFGSLASAEIYAPGTGTWAPVGDMNARRLWGSVDVSASDVLALLPDGRVLAAGGYDSCWRACGFVLHGSAELFDPASGAWTLVGPMVQARSHHRLSVLPTGHVLVVGGQAPSTVLGGAEEFDPATGTFVAVGALRTERYDYSATPLGGGRVLIAQGQGWTGALSSAEIFGVVVQSPQQAIGAIIGMLDGLASSGALQHGNANALAAPLRAAIQQLERGNTRAAMNQLQAFVNHLNALVHSGEIEALDAQSLLDAITPMMAALDPSSTSSARLAERGLSLR